MFVRKGNDVSEKKGLFLLFISIEMTHNIDGSRRKKIIIIIIIIIYSFIVRFSTF